MNFPTSDADVMNKSEECRAKKAHTTRLTFLGHLIKAFCGASVVIVLMIILMGHATPPEIPKF